MFRSSLCPSPTSFLLPLTAAVLLAACGGGDGGGGSQVAATTTMRARAADVATDAVAGTTPLDAARLADQATFGATETLIGEIAALGAAPWVKQQMTLAVSQYTSGGGDAVHKNASWTGFCSLPAYAGANCWRDWYSSNPLVWDFYRNAVSQPDQLRQRVAFALQQIAVVSELSVTGTYGLRNYHNALLDNAFGNYRDVLRKVTLSPVMGSYLNNVNNDTWAPNENFGRELLQLFALGTCELNADGTLKGGACTPTYGNDTVRNYAQALTGWTYPLGGASPWGCWPANCQFYGGDMVPVARFHDTASRALLSGVTVPSGSTAPQALELVLDSLMAHPNMAPFIGRQLIQHLVVSNPSPAYVQRVAAAFSTGSFASGGQTFGAGRAGDLAATVAAVLLDPEARSRSTSRSTGKLREPALVMAGVLRALNGKTDGEALGYQWGVPLMQHVFRAPSVFNFYPPDYPVAGGNLVGPAFGAHNTSTALARLNYLTYLVYWGGSSASSAVPNALGTRIDLTPFQADADDPARLVDRLSVLANGEPLPAATRDMIVSAVATYTAAGFPNTWRFERAKQAAYLVFASPSYNVQH